MNKKEIKERIEDFFQDISNKHPREVKKIKRLGMSINYKLGNLRRGFCKNCYAPLIPGLTCKIRIKKGVKTVTCNLCNTKNRWKLKN